MLGVKTILHPTDFSEYSDLAFKLACSLARDYGAKLIILHVAAPPTYIYGEGIVPPEPLRPLDDVREQLLAIQPKDIDVAVEHVLIEGDSVDEILKVADDSGADMIVLGTHGRGGIARLILGSVAEHIIRRASCPVVTVKKPARKPAPAPEKEVSETVPETAAFGVWP